MSFINICYRAALKSARYHGWRYSGGIDLQHPGKRQTYLWEHGVYECVSTEGVVPDNVLRKDIHTVLFTLKTNLIKNELDDDYLDDLLTAVREINQIDEWKSYLDDDF